MNAKTLTTVALLGFVGVSVVYLIAKESSGTTESTATAPASGDAAMRAAPETDTNEAMAAAPVNEAATTATQHKVVAYYFYGNYRCHTCRTIEEYAREAIYEEFVEPLEAGELVWRPVNIDEPEHAHFIQDYQLATRSLVIAEFEGDDQVAYKNLERVWQLVGNKDAFQDYVIEETEQYLAAG